MTTRRGLVAVLLLAGALALPLLGAAPGEQPRGNPKLTEVWEPVPAIVTPGVGSAPPSDAIVLFDGKDLSAWEHENGSAPKWTIADGAVTIVKKTGGLKTKRPFGDCQLHVEWRAPSKIEGSDQGRGNSGVFLQSRYEVQVLDSYENRTYSNGQVASIYKQHIPLVNACRKPGEWQTYDIVFSVPRFSDDGKVVKPGYVTVIHNGVLALNHVELKGSTAYIGQPAYKRHSLKEPLMLQDHENPVSYRNIWIREL